MTGWEEAPRILLSLAVAFALGMGIASAYELYLLAAVLSVTTLLALRGLRSLKQHPEQRGPPPRDDGG